MSGERFQQQEPGSFFGDFFYEQVVPPEHFLRQLQALVPWQRFSKKLVRLYLGKARQGRPPYDPAVLLKMLLVAHLYNLSERQTEEVANYHLPVKWFLGLAVNERAPDHSTLTKFKNRLLERGKLEAAEDLLAQIVGLAQQHGIRFGSLQVTSPCARPRMDSVHSEANVNPDKDKQRQQRQSKPPRDGEARWGVKGSRWVQDEQGRKLKRKEYFLGYPGPTTRAGKAHCSLNAESELITSVVVTPGNVPDGHQLAPLLARDLAQGLAVDIVTADRGYDDGHNHFLLQSKGVHSAIRLNDYRTKKKDPNKQVWLQLQATAEYQLGLKERYKIERKFGEAKSRHGLRRCRSLGLFRYGLQVLLTAIVLNLKRIIKMLTGVRSKGPVLVTG